MLERDLGHLHEARASLKRALAISGRLASDAPAARDRVVHVRTLDRLASIELAESPDAAVSLLEQAAVHLRPLASDGLVVGVDPDVLAFIYTHLGSALKAQGRREEAAERIRAAIAAYEVLVRESPENYLFRVNLATACFNLANLQLVNPEGADVRQNFERARDLWEGLAREFPTASSYHASLVATYGTLGVLHEQANQLDQARVALNRSREIGEGLVHDHPTTIVYRSDMSKTYLNLSVLESRMGRPGDAVALLGPARGCLREVFRARPGDRAAREALATACGNLATGLLELGRYEEALEAYRECADLELELMPKKDSCSQPNPGLLGPDFSVSPAVTFIWAVSRKRLRPLRS